MQDDTTAPAPAEEGEVLDLDVIPTAADHDPEDGIYLGTPEERAALAAQLRALDPMAADLLDLTAELPSEFFLRELFDIELSAQGLADVAQAWGRFEWAPIPVLAEGGVPHASAYRSIEETIADALNVHSSSVVIAAEPIHYVTVARALVGHWVAYKQGGDPSDAWEAQGFTRPLTDADAWRRFEDHLNSALAPFRTHVSIDLFGIPGRTPWGTTSPGLYSLTCLQLFNHMANDAPVRICANERCRRAVSRQTGRSQKGRYRDEGVKYCSRECARAQAQRDYAKRKKEQA